MSPGGVLRVHGTGHAGQGAGCAISCGSSHCHLRRGTTERADRMENIVASGNCIFLCSGSAVVCPGAAPESAVLSRVYPRAQSRAFRDKPLSPSRAVLVLHSSHAAGLGAVVSICDGGVGCCDLAI